VSEHLKKEKLLRWLRGRLWSPHATAYNRVAQEIESGRFDTPDSEDWS
jgi:hypothetical protein